ncbi:unnamed protein product [Effrenium voratum]|nr:unnamed protein product [Effrenium voratum]CAJ1456865.1 unnamed protein product [Effrenium voratum]
MWSFTQSRVVLGRELMRFQGLNPPGEVMDTYDEVKLGNLAGNAFAGNVMLAVVMSVLVSLRFASPSEAEEENQVHDMLEDLARLRGAPE